jgi:hypothetical protein
VDWFIWLTRHHRLYIRVEEFPDLVSEHLSFVLSRKRKTDCSWLCVSQMSAVPHNTSLCALEMLVVLHSRRRRVCGWWREETELCCQFVLCLLLVWWCDAISLAKCASERVFTIFVTVKTKPLRLFSCICLLCVYVWVLKFSCHISDVPYSLRNSTFDRSPWMNYTDQFHSGIHLW